MILFRTPMYQEPSSCISIEERPPDMGHTADQLLLERQHFNPGG